ncbi:hypothetical protein [Actinoplanes friuliensis]|uniref:Uncharacterized protein n=1 Tax=Actinoplanes friuliensis DSM 7358 TaxID=1246995 RepID=U5W270_9ACTN|nr:hypothetical protein [Actinoplanes friuliensis]AGZ42055.1 hypothetical protein AFR_18905 [Actinoplanes friuliensis DSM 7358]
MRQQDERDLRTVLREEAERHRPDRDAMRDRIARGRAEETRRPMDRVLSLMRPLAAAAAVAVVLGLGIAGVRLSDQGGIDDSTTPVAAPTTFTPATPAPTKATPAAPRASASSGTTTRTQAAHPGKDGFLSSSGRLDPHSNDGWSQDNVVLTTTRTITELKVSVHVALTAGVVETGRWSTVPANLLSMTSSRKDDTLVFRFTLAKGAKLGPGSYTFAVQFNHAAGKRSPAGDTYSAEAAAGDKDVQVTGTVTTK